MHGLLAQKEDPVRIMLAGRRQIIRSAMRLLLEQSPQVTVVAEANDVDETLRVASEVRPDVIVAGVDPPTLDPVLLASRALKLDPPVPVLLVTGNHEPAFISRALQSPIAGYISTDIDVEALIDALRTVRSGLMVLGSQAVDILRRRFRSLGYADIAASLGVPLTTREIQVLDLMKAGKSNKEIATVLGIGIRTAEMHVSHITQKLGVQSRTEAIIKILGTHRTES